MDLEIGEDHPARTIIWELVRRLDLSRLCEGIESSAEEGGWLAIAAIVSLPVGLPAKPGNRIGPVTGGAM